MSKYRVGQKFEHESQYVSMEIEYVCKELDFDGNITYVVKVIDTEGDTWYVVMDDHSFDSAVEIIS